MPFELDHIFVATSDPEPLEWALADAGLAFTQRRIHGGQGTANACAVFENAFLEILSERLATSPSLVLRW